MFTPFFRFLSVTRVYPFVFANLYFPSCCSFFPSSCSSPPRAPPCPLGYHPSFHPELSLQTRSICYKIRLLSVDPTIDLPHYQSKLFSSFHLPEILDLHYYSKLFHIVHPPSIPPTSLTPYYGPCQLPVVVVSRHRLLVRWPHSCSTTSHAQQHRTPPPLPIKQLTPRTVYPRSAANKHDDGAENSTTSCLPVTRPIPTYTERVEHWVSCTIATKKADERREGYQVHAMDANEMLQQ